MKKINGMKNLVLALTLFLALASCKQEKEVPKVRYSSEKKDSKPIIDSADLQVSDLPIEFPNTDVLVFPVGNVNFVSRDSKIGSETSSKSYSTQSFNVSNYNDFEITGYLTNLKFQKQNTDSLEVLTNKSLLIESVTYLKNFADKSNKKILLYSLADADTNQDNAIDQDDIKSIYASDIYGKEFQKLSPDLQEVIDWNVLEGIKRLYFRTIEDFNKNGAFDAKDKVHYFYVDLMQKELKAVEYKPI